MLQHPELFKYSGDQTDKEWLAKASLMATTGGKVTNTDSGSYDDTEFHQTNDICGWKEESSEADEGKPRTSSVPFCYEMSLSYSFLGKISRASWIGQAYPGVLYRKQW